MAVAALHSAMTHADFVLADGRPKVVGSFGSPDDLRDAEVSNLPKFCDIAEIRLDLLGDAAPARWRHLVGFPLLFTARRADEGGARDLDAAARMKLLETAMEDASFVDVEVASIRDMSALLNDVKIPWIASFHDFEKLPRTCVLATAARQARDAGAAVFKIAARLNSPSDLTLLAEFQLADHGIPVATMGMGALAPVSRLLCAQCGSVLNYGFLGKTATAPGQWDAALLKQAIAGLADFRI